ncbi:hypothetical protein EG68_05783 [Paragonimus skrjabini miyazakii]|uniref:Little elongation complex subunit 2 C-terminal domain-containing protein n=1 Tax=Paragonimus skrjabini miyazakii TaxID=59628 RepID=A0A8S9YUX6_9TREM|nr:hypothetical protein EG68_05783 [Paragonimus skrjabini miyazakii]
MLFLGDSTISDITPPEFDLLTVQKTIFHYFDDLRATIDETKLSSAIDSDTESVEAEGGTCPCHLQPHIHITSEDVRQYTQLLSDFTGDLAKLPILLDVTDRRAKIAEVNKLQLMHAKITQSQLLVQKCLEDSQSCAHVSIGMDAELLIQDFFTTQQKIILNHICTLYRFNRPVSITLGVKASHAIELKIAEKVTAVHLPAHERLSLSFDPVLSHFAHEKAEQEDHILTRRKSVNLKEANEALTDSPELVLSATLLSLLFGQSSLVDVYIPFTVVVGNSDASLHSCHRVEFCDPIYSRPLDARSRARLYFEFGFYSKCISDLPTFSSDCSKLDDSHVNGNPQVEPNCASSVSSTICKSDSAGAPRRMSLRSRAKSTVVHDTPVLDIPPKNSCCRPEQYSSPSSSSTRVTRQQASKQASRPHITSSLTDDKSGNNSPTTPVSSATRRFNRRSVIPDEDTDDDDDEPQQLSIDVDSATVSNSAPVYVPSSTMLEIAASCAVVSRRRKSDNISESKDEKTPNSPDPDAPSSPDPQEISSECLKSPHSDLVIPLEPIKPTKQLDESSVVQLSTPASSTSSSWVILNLGGVRARVHYPDTRWSHRTSCLACNRNGESVTEMTGRCALWPSCSSRCTLKADTAAGAEITDFTPIFVQLRPEYLGDWGCEVLSQFELADSWLGSTLRGGADILRVRVRVDTGAVIWAEYQTLEELMSANPGLRPEVNLGALSSLFEELSKLPVGSYLLTQNAASHSAGSFDLYEAVNGCLADMDPSEAHLFVDLRDVHERFLKTSSNVIEMLPTIKSEKHECSNLPDPSVSSLLKVNRLKLDLSLPAGLEPNDSSDEKSERGLCLPGLPFGRLLECPADTKTSLTASASQPKKRRDRSNRSKLSDRQDKDAPRCLTRSKQRPNERSTRCRKR